MSKDKKTYIKENVKELDYYVIEDWMKFIMGKVLTIIDASIQQEQQNKAIKDLIKSEFRDKLFSIQKVYWGNSRGHSPIF